VIFRVSVQPCARGGSPNPDPPQAFGRPGNPLGIARHRPGISAKLLPQPHGHRILQVGSPRFDHVVKFLRFALQRLSQSVHHPEQFIQPPQAPQPDGGWDHVIGRL